MLKNTRTAFLAIALLLSSFTFSQDKEAINNKYSSEEIQIFIKLYEYKLNHPFELAVSMENSLKTTTISEERMTIILQTQFAENELKLSKKEKEELKKMKELMEIDKAKHDTHFNAFIIENKMKLSRYKEIEIFFYNNTHFQNRVSELRNKNTTN